MEAFVTRAEAASPGRAAQLFESLSSRYVKFAHQLPSPLEHYAQLKGTYAGFEDDTPMDGVGWMNPVLSGTPWLFWELFSVLDDECFLAISEAGMYLVLASVIQDHTVDNQNSDPETAALLHQAMFSAAISTYGPAFPRSSPFWTHFERLQDDHIRGLAKELEARGDPAALSEEGLTISAHGKVSPIVTTIAALAFASEQPQLLTPIERSLKHIAVASQLLDDIGDWQEDVRDKHLTRFLAQLGSTETWLAKEWPSVETLQDGIDGRWLDVFGLSQIKTWLEEALQDVDHLNCPGWKAYVQDYWDRANKNQMFLAARRLATVIGPSDVDDGRPSNADR
jgi:hypothetical protein